MFPLLAIAALAGLFVAVGRGSSGARTTPTPPGGVDANGFRVFKLAPPEVIEAARDNAPGALRLVVDLVDGEGAIWRTVVGPTNPGGTFAGRLYSGPRLAPPFYPFSADEVAAIIGYVPASPGA